MSGNVVDDVNWWGEPTHILTKGGDIVNVYTRYRQGQRTKAEREYAVSSLKETIARRKTTLEGLLCRAERLNNDIAKMESELATAEKEQNTQHRDAIVTVAHALMRFDDLNDFHGVMIRTDNGNTYQINRRR